MSFALKAFGVCLATYVVFLLYLTIFQRSFLYFPSGDEVFEESWAADFLVSVRTGDGLDLRGAYMPAADASLPVIVFFHGNAGTIVHRRDKVQRFVDEGYGVLLAEYRGYGGNAGTPSEQGLYADGRAYLDFLAARGVGAEDIVLYGESLGSGVAVQMATQRAVRAVVLDVPFESVLNVAGSKFPYVPFLGMLLRDHYNNEAKIAQVDAPVFIGLAGRDAVVPMHFGRALYEAAAEPKAVKVYEGAAHAEIHRYGFDRDVVGFLENL